MHGPGSIPKVGEANFSYEGLAASPLPGDPFRKALAEWKQIRTSFFTPLASETSFTNQAAQLITGLRSALADDRLTRSELESIRATAGRIIIALAIAGGIKLQLQRGNIFGFIRLLQALSPMISYGDGEPFEPALTPLQLEVASRIETAYANDATRAAAARNLSTWVASWSDVSCNKFLLLSADNVTKFINRILDATEDRWSLLSVLDGTSGDGAELIGFVLNDTGWQSFQGVSVSAFRRLVGSIDFTRSSLLQANPSLQEAATQAVSDLYAFLTEQESALPIEGIETLLGASIGKTLGSAYKLTVDTAAQTISLMEISSGRRDLVSGTREANNQRADAEVRVHSVQKNDMSIPDGAALAGVVALCVAEAQLSAGVFQGHCWRFVRRAVAIFRAHLKLEGRFGDARHRVNDALHRIMLARASRAANELKTHPHIHALRLHGGATEVLALPFAVQRPVWF